MNRKSIRSLFTMLLEILWFKLFFLIPKKVNKFWLTWSHKTAFTFVINDRIDLPLVSFDLLSKNYKKITASLTCFKNIDFFPALFQFLIFSLNIVHNFDKGHYLLAVGFVQFGLKNYARIDALFVSHKICP